MLSQPVAPEHMKIYPTPIFEPSVEHAVMDGGSFWNFGRVILSLPTRPCLNVYMMISLYTKIEYGSGILTRWFILGGERVHLKPQGLRIEFWRWKGAKYGVWGQNGAIKGQHCNRIMHFSPSNLPLACVGNTWEHMYDYCKDGFLNRMLPSDIEAKTSGFKETLHLEQQ